MKAPPFTAAVIITSRRGAHKRLKLLLDFIVSTGMSAELVETAADARARLVGISTRAWCCAFVDASLPVGTAMSPAHQESVLERIHILRQSLDDVAILTVGREATGAMVTAAHRAGAHGFVDLSTETPTSFESMLRHVSAEVSGRYHAMEAVRQLRATVEEFLRELVKTERRSIDLEHQLERSEDSPRAHALDVNRCPRVLILEDDKEVVEVLVRELTQAGMEVVCASTGEQGVGELKTSMEKGDGIDLVLVDAKLPGMDGLEALRRMRRIYPHLAAILMTGYSDSRTAVDAADLGVRGYVLKPFGDIPGFVARICEQAVFHRDRRREHHYLSRIKQRHDRLLLRYRQIVADIDRYS